VTAPNEKRVSLDADAGELWAILSSAEPPHEVVDYPVSPKFKAKDLVAESIAIVPITLEERLCCQAEADETTRKYLKTLPKKDEDNRAYESIFDMDCTVRVLWRACRVPGDLRRKVFPSPGEIRRRLTADQVSILSLHYARVERSLSPIEVLASDEEMDAFVEKLRAGGRKFPLDYLPSEALRELIWRLASRLPPSPSDSSSSGSPPDESSSPPEPPPSPEPGPGEEMPPEEEHPEDAAPAERRPPVVHGGTDPVDPT
jgi:hypothetical protein